MRGFHLLLVTVIGLALGARAASAETVKVKLGILSGAAQSAIVVAVEKGFFAKHGFDVDARHLVGGIQGSQALASGQVDWSAGGIEPTIIAAAHDLPFKPYAMYAKGGDSYGVLARDGIATIADLRGKTVAISPGSAPEQGFEDLLTEKKVPLGSIRHVNASFTMMGQMLIQGSVDAMVGIEPYLTLTEDKMHGKAVLLGRLGRFVQGGGFFYISDAWAAAHPKKVIDAVEALWEAEHFVRHHPKEAAQIEARFIKADPSVVAVSFRYLQFNPTVDPFTVKSFDKSVAYLLARHHIPHSVSAATVLAPALQIGEELKRTRPELLQ